MELTRRHRNSARNEYQRARELAAQLPPLLLDAERIAATVAQGLHGRRRAGPGDSFWQFRRYQPGDSAHLVDWRKSARSQALYVREREWESAASVWMWCDQSASMEFRSGRELRTKRQRAQVVLLALASLLINGGERVALMEPGQTPSSGRGTIRRLAGLLAERGARDAVDTANLPPALPIPRRGHVVLVSDFFTDLDALADLLHAYGENDIDGVVVQVLDPAEETLPYEGHVQFLDPEQGVAAETLRRVEGLRDAYRARFAAHQETLQHVVQRLGWRLVRHRTDHRPESLLAGLYASLSDRMERR